ncbi:MAG TPA: hypothetical protein ENN42_04140 [Thioalkalivibrio sp.]|nr:hypothetical protein [Thioalkalivibrio sp.]
MYRISEAGSEFVERRENAKYGGDESMKHGDPKKAKSSLGALEGVQVWASPRFGPNLPRLLEKIQCVVVRVPTVDQGVGLIRDNLAAVAQEQAQGPERQHVVLKPQ